MSDTPETDQWTGLRHDVRQLVETSRRLERERNHNRRLYETENKDLQGLLKNLRRLFALLSDSTPSKPTKP